MPHQRRYATRDIVKYVPKRGQSSIGPTTPTPSTVHTPRPRCSCSVAGRGLERKRSVYLVSNKLVRLVCISSQPQRRAKPQQFRGYLRRIDVWTSNYYLAVPTPRLRLFAMLWDLWDCSYGAMPLHFPASSVTVLCFASEILACRCVYLNLHWQC